MYGLQYGVLRLARSNAIAIVVLGMRKKGGQIGQDLKVQGTGSFTVPRLRLRLLGTRPMQAGGLGL